MKKAILSAVTIGVALSAAVGCGSGFPTAPSRYGETNTMIDPAFKTAPVVNTGAVQVIVNDGFKTQAVAADVANIKVTVVPTGASPVIKTVAKGQTATIDGLPAGKIAITIDALDASGNIIGTVSRDDIDIVAGQTTTVNLSLKLNPTVVAPTTGGLGLNLTLVDGDVIVASPTPGPSATPTPTPTATPTAPPAGGTLNDGFESGLGNWTASFVAASYSSAGTASSNWNASTGAAKTGSYGATAGNTLSQVSEPGTYRLTYAATINTGAMTSPKIDFDFAKFTKQYYFKSGSFKVETSTDGSTWSDAWVAPADQVSWAHISADLPHSGTLRVRFSFAYDYYLGIDPFGAPAVDNVVVSDAL